ncbi:MAG: hypothetical protein HY898_21320 [Deltaproteobacteria bacterium]|nr:hypothetical protein [Deltaproteobacteria bacterium]
MAKRRGAWRAINAVIYVRRDDLRAPAKAAHETCSGAATDAVVAALRNSRFKLVAEPVQSLPAPKQAPRSSATGDPRLQHASRLWHLTRRQAEVLELVAAGLQNREVAEVLGTKVRTVEHHVTDLLEKSDTTRRTELLASYFALVQQA